MNDTRHWQVEWCASCLSCSSVAEKLKSEGRAEIFRDETMEELEDDEGNVYNRKVRSIFLGFGHLLLTGLWIN